MAIDHQPVHHHFRVKSDIHAWVNKPCRKGQQKHIHDDCEISLGYAMDYNWDIWYSLVGGLEHDFYDFPIILGMSSSQLTFIPWFFRGVGLNHQPDLNPQVSPLILTRTQGLAGEHWILSGGGRIWRDVLGIRWDLMGDIVRMYKHMIICICVYIYDIWHVMVWSDMFWFDMTWYGRTWYDIVFYFMAIYFLWLIL